MATKHASSGEVIDLRPLGAPLDDSHAGKGASHVGKGTHPKGSAVMARIVRLVSTG